MAPKKHCGLGGKAAGTCTVHYLLENVDFSKVGHEKLKTNYGFKSELASGWDFFGIPNPDLGDSGSRFLNFG